ncbi:dihydropyrimidinase [Saccharicrinis carchari]|uniref:Dihydropyrimidinase n=1 Tax=Saccharicrinis carchari TaxID=1168039 RepID=A0A521B101_SACCC|nr:amidohydrolase family protein [Saccharicrinis carchari]SMO40768.1 dihydropyrimidinase [Saccharicrinis carchari]
MNYIVIKNGFVVKESAIITEDILVGGNKVLQIGQNLPRPNSETPVIDATGKYVLPGAVDMNRHFLYLGKNEKTKKELKKLNQAEIYNGTTTMLDAVDSFHGKNYLHNISNAKEMAHYNLIDYGFHLSFADAKKNMVGALDHSYIHEGISTILVNISSWDNFNINILESTLRAASSYPLLIICDLIIPEAGKNEEDQAELNGTNVLNRHLQSLTELLQMGLKHKCPLMFLNVEFKEELNRIQEGIKKGGEFFVSINMPFSIDISDITGLARPDKLSGLSTRQPLSPISAGEVWQLVKNKRFLINPPPYNIAIEDSVEEGLVYNRPDKFFYLRNYLSMLFTVGVSEGQINILDMVDIVSARPAKIMGLWPQKGVLQPGADADFVVWNPTFDRNLYCSILSADRQSFKKYKLKGRPDFVFAKGRMMYNGESFYPKHADGSFVYRSAPML